MKDESKKEEAKTIKKAEAKPVVDATHATKLFNEIKSVKGITEKAVANGIGLWAGTTRIVKKPAKGFAPNGLIFKGEVKGDGANKVRKNTLVPVTNANFSALKNTVMATIGAAQEAMTAKAAKKAKAKAEKVAPKEAAAAVISAAA